MTNCDKIEFFTAYISVVQSTHQKQNIITDGAKGATQLYIKTINANTLHYI